MLTCFNKQSPLPAELPCRSCRSSACSNATSTGGGVVYMRICPRRGEFNVVVPGDGYRVPIHADPDIHGSFHKAATMGELVL